MSPTTRTRRIAARVAVAGALAAVPITALAIPASADPISDATTLVNDWQHNGQWNPGQWMPGQNRDRDHDWRRDRRDYDAPPPPPVQIPAPTYIVPNLPQSLPSGIFGSS